MTPDKREHSLNLIVLQDLIREQKAELEQLRHVIFTLAMIDRDSMTEHDEALLEDAIERSKELYGKSRRT